MAEETTGRALDLGLNTDTLDRIRKGEQEKRMVKDSTLATALVEGLTSIETSVAKEQAERAAYDEAQALLNEAYQTDDAFSQDQRDQFQIDMEERSEAFRGMTNAEQAKELGKLVTNSESGAAWGESMGIFSNLLNPEEGPSLLRPTVGIPADDLALFTDVRTKGLPQFNEVTNEMEYKIPGVDGAEDQVVTLSDYNKAIERNTKMDLKSHVIDAKWANEQIALSDNVAMFENSAGQMERIFNDAHVFGPRPMIDDLKAALTSNKSTGSIPIVGATNIAKYGKYDDNGDGQLDRKERLDIGGENDAETIDALFSTLMEKNDAGGYVHNSALAGLAGRYLTDLQKQNMNTTDDETTKTTTSPPSPPTSYKLADYGFATRADMEAEYGVDTVQGMIDSGQLTIS
tara:strand:- start:114 stop:1319 length:1206 start_codon:yes stop_codon:yes gene_type:complete